MHCLILKLQGPKLEKCRSYGTEGYINYNDALRPNIYVLVVLWSIVRLGYHRTNLVPFPNWVYTGYIGVSRGGVRGPDPPPFPGPM